MANLYKKYFTSKKASKMALLGCAINLIGLFIFYFCMYNYFVVAGKIILPLVFVVFAVWLYIFVYTMYSYCSKSGREENILSDLKKFLSQEYTEVQLKFFGESTFNTIIEQILINEEIKFYAKFAPSNNIVVIAKDKNDIEVYKEELKNLEYFNDHFKVK